MTFATIFNSNGNKHRCATAADIADLFGDYHNLLRWLASFLIEEEELAADSIVDACTIAPTQAPLFHEWLVHWAARATVRCAFQIQESEITQIASGYDCHHLTAVEALPLSVDQFQFLVKNSKEIRSHMDAVCRIVLVLRGIARDSFKEIATQLRIPQRAVEFAYSTAIDHINVLSKEQHSYAI